VFSAILRILTNAATRIAAVGRIRGRGATAGW
jgi:hypothetical protein